MEFFFLLVKIQARWPLVPRINFRPIVIVTKDSQPAPPKIETLRQEHRSPIRSCCSLLLPLSCRRLPHRAAAAARRFFRARLARPAGPGRLETFVQTAPNSPAICCWRPMRTEISSSSSPKFHFRWRPRRFPAANGRLNLARTNIRGADAARRRTASPGFNCRAPCSAKIRLATGNSQNVTTNSWRLENPRTGETLEGEFFP